MSTQSGCHAQSPHHASVPPPALQKQSPLQKCTHLRRRPIASRSKNMPDPHAPAQSSLVRKPTLKPTKGREPTEPKPKPNAETSPPRDQPRPARHPNHAEPSDPPPPDITVTGVRKRNLDKEPESEPEPPRSKQCPCPPKANHPPPSRKKTYTQPIIQTTPRTHKTLDTQDDSAPPPPTDPPPRQQSALLEGESTCNEMSHVLAICHCKSKVIFIVITAQLDNVDLPHLSTVAQVPYLPSSKDQIQNVMKLLEGRRGRLADLGAGDGRLTDLCSYNNVTAFLAPGVMEVLGEKLLKELPQDALVISCRFPFPNWPQKSTVGSGLDQTFAYEISSVRSHLRNPPKTEMK
ncbi:hypothetical protein AMECASPLE_007564 [Ameca splendens]|uniref:Uncharacterized protein n=1 Tax=Ameca splendens TaxID=208324 RepID=A0ABV0YXX6_9TELE